MSTGPTVLPYVDRVRSLPSHRLTNRLGGKATKPPSHPTVHFIYPPPALNRSGPLTCSFNEMDPSSSDPVYLKETNAAIYNAMIAADPRATFVMQGWCVIARA